MLAVVAVLVLTAAVLIVEITSCTKVIHLSQPIIAKYCKSTSMDWQFWRTLLQSAAGHCIIGFATSVSAVLSDDQKKGAVALEREVLDETSLRAERERESK